MSGRTPETDRFYSETYGAEYRADEIRAYYDKDFISNLLALPYEKTWVLPSRSRVLKGPKYYESWRNDPFLEEHEARGDRAGLALDIRDRGTYWPLVGRLSSDGTFLVKEGIHRIYSIGLARARGSWPRERRLLALLVPDFQGFCSNPPEHFGLVEAPLERPVMMRVPVDGAGVLVERYGRIYERIASKGLDTTRKAILDVECTTHWEVTRGYQIFTTYLRDLIFVLEKRTGIAIPPHREINDAEGGAFARAT
jgi:hypothetical protein